MSTTSPTTTTNGLLLNKHKEVIDWMITNAPGTLLVSLQCEEDKVVHSISEILSGSQYRFVRKSNSKELINIEYFLLHKEMKFNIRISETGEFSKRYRGYGKKIYPFDNKDIVAAHGNCIDRPLLYKGRLYKCSKSALLRKQLKLTGQLYSEEDKTLWNPYVNENGMSYNDDESELIEFIEHINDPSYICGSCPLKNENDSIIQHKANVFTKASWKRRFWNK